MYFCIHNCMSPSKDYAAVACSNNNQAQLHTHSRISSLQISRCLTRPRVASRYSVRTSSYFNRLKPYSTLLITSYCTLRRKDSLCALTCRFCVSRKGGTGGGGWHHPQGAVHMAAARLGCKRTMVGTGWANSRPGCMNALRKCYCHLSGGSFLAEKASLALSGCLPIESADYCMLVNEWAYLVS